MKFDERHAHPEQLLMALADTTAIVKATKEDAHGDGTRGETQKVTSSDVDDVVIDPANLNQIDGIR